MSSDRTYYDNHVRIEHGGYPSLVMHVVWKRRCGKGRPESLELEKRYYVIELVSRSDTKAREIFWDRYSAKVWMDASGYEAVGRWRRTVTNPSHDKDSVWRSTAGLERKNG